MQPQKIVATIKRELKKQGVTYGELAVGLGMSTAGIKKMFSVGDFSIRRLGEICSFLNIDERDFFRALVSEEHLQTLSLAQETELACDETLLLVFYYLLTGHSVELVAKELGLAKIELFKQLKRLDELALIEVSSQNKVRLLISRAPQWLPDGPLSQRFGKSLLREFYASDFQAENEQHNFQTGPLSEESFRIICRKQKQLADEFLSLADLDRQLGSSKTNTYWMVSAIRPWSPLGVIAREIEEKR